MKRLQWLFAALLLVGAGLLAALVVIIQGAGDLLVGLLFGLAAALPTALLVSLATLRDDGPARAERPPVAVIKPEPSALTAWEEWAVKEGIQETLNAYGVFGCAVSMGDERIVVFAPTGVVSQCARQAVQAVSPLRVVYVAREVLL